MKMKAKRLISLILALMLLATGLSVVSFAENGAEMPSEPEEQVGPAEEEPIPDDVPEVIEDCSTEVESEVIEESPIQEEPSDELIESEAEVIPETSAEEPTEEIILQEIESEDDSTQEAESEPEILTFREAIATKGFAYVATIRNADVFSDSDMSNPVFTLEGRGNIVFATFCNKAGAVLVSFAINDEESITGYVSEKALEDIPLSDKDVEALTQIIPNMEDFSPVGISVMFLAKGHRVEIEAEAEVLQPKETDMPAEPEIVDEPVDTEAIVEPEEISETESSTEPIDAEPTDEPEVIEEIDSQPVIEQDVPNDETILSEDESVDPVPDEETESLEVIEDESAETEQTENESVETEAVDEPEVIEEIDLQPVVEQDDQATPSEDDSAVSVPDEETELQEPIEDETTETEQAEIEPVEEDPVEEAPVEEITTDVPVEDVPEATDETPEIIPEPEAEPEPEYHHSVGDYVGVTTSTRVYFGIDNSITEGDDGVNYLGVFTKNAVVQIVAVGKDDFGKNWYKVNYLYGDDFANGTLKWTAYGIVYVLESDTQDTDSTVCTVTDWAYTKDDLYRINRSMLRLTATPMNGFTLKNISVTLPKFKVGQTGLYGSSGRDSDYPQIAKSSAHGTIYATPHYLEGYTVYCLEHNLSGPGEGSGSNQSAKGPYVLVDMDGFCNTDAGKGVSGVRYKESTMHAIGWVLRHTYPFMALNRSDSNNETWSRVAGQFAIREVIKQLEGAKYVRDYWDMDNFYSFSGGAPSVYLTYARWLAENGVARASITGKITASSQSLTVSGSNYIGKVTLKTDADLIRIPKSVGTLTGNTGGSDSTYYYLKSGDTISITSSKSKFTVTMESISSADEEANFLIGIPSAQIQKVLIPIAGAPNTLKSASLTFELSEGEIAVVKKSTDGILLKGTVFELLNSSGTVLKTATTDGTGKVVFENLAPGSYKVREKTASEGYSISATATQNVTVTAGATSNVTFTNERITGVIKIVKKDSATNQPLPGATFTVTRLTGPASDNASDIGKVVATITTNKQGIAQTGLLPWGQYKVQETGIPDGYLDPGYSTTVTIK